MVVTLVLAKVIAVVVVIVAAMIEVVVVALSLSSPLPSLRHFLSSGTIF